MADEKVGRERAREHTERDGYNRTTLDDGRQIFGRNLLEIRRRHPYFNTQLEIAREMHALGYPGYATGSGAEEVIVAKKISKFERGSLTPSLPEAAAIARILNTTLDALTDTRGTIETHYDTAEEAWDRFSDSILSFYNSFNRANVARVDFRTAQEDLRNVGGVPLFAPEGILIWDRLWGALSNDVRADLVEAMNADFGKAQGLRKRSAQRNAEWDKRLRERLREAETRLEGADLKRSHAYIVNDIEVQKRREARTFMATPLRQLAMLDMLDGLPDDVDEVAGEALNHEGNENVTLTLVDESGARHVYTALVEVE